MPHGREPRVGVGSGWLRVSVIVAFEIAVATILFLLLAPTVGP
jgi:hypothetical protein